MNWLIGHLVGDFLLQNDWMAINKKSHWLPACVHCLVYTIVVWLFCQISPNPWPLWTIPVIFISHIALDATMFVHWLAKVMGREKFVDMGSPYYPWSLVTIDNSIHLLSLFIIDQIVLYLV